mmetsp:Transcript_33861/g.95146  ORF Transcript_33861/g.95146 Transcript_33861/m.95146 type:complete len:420 (-) Transcript_33861:5-1264(-)
MEEELVQGEVFRRVKRKHFSFVVQWHCEWARLVQDFLVFFASSTDSRVTGAIGLSTVVDVRVAAEGDALPASGSCPGLRLRAVTGGHSEDTYLRTLDPEDAVRWVNCIQVARARAGSCLSAFVPSKVVSQALEERRDHARQRCIDISNTDGEFAALRAHLQRVLLRASCTKLLARRLGPCLRTLSRAGEADGTALVRVALGLRQLVPAIRHTNMRMARWAFWRVHRHRCNGPRAPPGRGMWSREGCTRRRLSVRRVIHAWFHLATASSTSRCRDSPTDVRALETLGQRWVHRWQSNALRRLGQKEPPDLMAGMVRARLTGQALRSARRVWHLWCQGATSRRARRHQGRAEGMLPANEQLLQDTVNLRDGLAVRSMLAVVKRARKRHIGSAFFSLVHNRLSCEGPHDPRTQLTCAQLHGR